LRIDFKFDKSEANSLVDLAALAGNIENTKAGIRPKILIRSDHLAAIPKRSRDYALLLERVPRVPQYQRD
jgi:hypothetical protein